MPYEINDDPRIAAADTDSLFVDCDHCQATGYVHSPSDKLDMALMLALAKSNNLTPSFRIILQKEIGHTEPTETCPVCHGRKEVRNEQLDPVFRTVRPRPL
jgi:hypothetical protein